MARRSSAIMRLETADGCLVADMVSRAYDNTRVRTRARGFANWPVPDRRCQRKLRIEVICKVPACEPSVGERRRHVKAGRMVRRSFEAGYHLELWWVSVAPSCWRSGAFDPPFNDGEPSWHRSTIAARRRARRLWETLVGWGGVRSVIATDRVHGEASSSLRSPDR